MKARLKSEEIAEILRDRLQSRVYSAGDFLPPERSLAQEFGVSRPTVRKALALLVHQKWLIPRPGLGTRVVAPGPTDIGGERQSWKVIAFVVADITSRFYMEVTEAIEYAALQRGYQILLCSTHRRLSTEQTHLRQLAERHVDGVIIAHDRVREFPDNLSLLRQSNIPFVFMFNAPTRAEFDTVVLDNKAGVRQVMRYLLSLGHHRIAFCRPVTQDQVHARELAFREISTEYGLAIPDDFILPLEALSEERGATMLEKLLHDRQAPTAIFAGNDRLALIVVKHLAKLNIRVPDDVSVVGFDNLSFTEHLSVPLTTVDQPKKEMGRRAAELLFERIELGADIPARHEVFHPRLVIRDSCAIASPNTWFLADAPAHPIGSL